MIISEPNLWNDKNNFYINALRSDWYRRLVKLENLITEETVRFYSEKGICTLHLPVTTGSISSPMGRGSDSKPVRINLEGIETYLADSMQFLLEYGCRLCDNGCYYLMPSFRGEKADERHLCQFYHSEAEIPGKLEDVIDLVEEYIKYLSNRILERMGAELKDSVGDVSHVERVASYEGSFKRITFDEVEKYFIENYSDDIDKYIEYNDGWRQITKKAEKALVKKFGFVWVTNYDELAVPFYQKTDDKLIGTARNADLLIGIGETVGCGERHLNDVELINALEKHCVDVKEYEWYINMKKEFSIQTSGFGMGVERFLMWILKAEDIRNMQICLRFNGENILP